MTVDQQAGTSRRRRKPYPAYKDTGVEWLGQIPAHWRVTKMWDVAQATSGGTPAKETLRYWDGGIPWVSPKDMKRRFIDSSEDTVSAAAVSETGLRLVANPAVLVVVRGMILAHSFPVGITKVPITINQDMKALRLRDDVTPEFFGYWLEGTGRDLIAVLVDDAAHGTKAIRMDRWRVTPVAIPPEDEQRAIAACLDQETARIDGLVAKKERLVELLQEKRAALITRAVTRGLDPTVPMKDSGVEWLGQIPAHWEVEENRWLFRESDTRSQLGEEILLTVSHITGVTPRAEKPDVTMIEAESHEGYKICCSGELAINTMWAWMGALGIAFQHGMVSPSMCTESPRLGLFRATTTTCVGFRTTSRRSFVTRRESGNRGYGCTRMPSAES